MIRHGESLKNTLNTYSSVSGDEPLTKYGQYQAQCIADFIKEFVQKHNKKRVAIFAASDTRSLNTAMPISNSINVPLIKCDELTAFSCEKVSGLLMEDIHIDNPQLGHKVSLYRAGLLSGYNVPWPSGNTLEIEQIASRFLNDRLINNGQLSIVISHKSIITCLAIQLLRAYSDYPKEYYGYVDIPPGSGLLFDIDNEKLNTSVHSFSCKKKIRHTDIVVRDGIIIFPESACAVCWKDNKLLLVKQSRPQKETWELPGGKIEHFEDPIVAASRELKEETGVSGVDGTLLYSLDLDHSISFHRTYLVEFKKVLETNLYEKNVQWIPYESVKEKILSGEISHAPTIVAFLSK